MQTSPPTCLNTGTTGETFHQSGKQEAFRFMFKRSANMYESSASEFFKIIISMQSGPDVLEETRSVINFLTISKVT